MADPDAKRQRVEADGAEDIDPQCLQDLADVQTKLDKVNDEASDKVLEVEQKYNKIRRPIYEERNKVIANIPEFWQHALLNHGQVRLMVTEDDVKVLKYCTEVDVQDFEDIKSGFRITFKFSEGNPCFSNASLTRSFCYAEDGSLSIKGDVPHWTEEYSPYLECPPAGGKRHAVPQYQLMSWFTEAEDLEPGTQDELADIIKEEIWPNPIKFYQGVEMVDEDGEGEIEDYELGADEGEEYELQEGEEDEMEAYEGEEEEEEAEEAEEGDEPAAAE